MIVTTHGCAYKMCSAVSLSRLAALPFLRSRIILSTSSMEKSEIGLGGELYVLFAAEYALKALTKLSGEFGLHIPEKVVAKDSAISCSTM